MQMSNEDIISRIQLSPLMQAKKEELIAICRGEKLPQLTNDTVAKRIFSPDVHPDRYAFLMEHIWEDDSIKIRSSATNEFFYTSMDAKKIISDIPAWFKDRRLADLEMQVAAQSFIDIRTELYGSEMVMLQYSVKKGERHSELDYQNVPGILMVVMMRHSPELFRKAESPKYIHKVDGCLTDTGIKLRTLRSYYSRKK